ncbi:MAG: hypothetical protein LIO96_08140 [Lachnospiraceae bacterium]|nr:hypothetical protein [Lachnospiraceae bacterium]
MLSCLLNDCPYELYWFNKTKGIATSYSISSDGTKVSISDITITFYVASDYQSGGSNTTVDTSKVEAAKTAAANAKEIVDKYSSYSDAEKLKAYKNEICDLVSYNTEAASGDYGDAWNLIYVFDGDENTKVVCEGYSKAFQYLCDLSDFDDVSCYIVTGEMTGGTGEGSHMWNVVSLDGENYLADITNSDTGTVGENGGLFLVSANDADASSANGYTFKCNNNSVVYAYDTATLSLYTADVLTLGTHEHTWDSGVVTTAATCTEAGVKTYTCTVCGETKTEEIAATGHTVVTDKAVAATCTETGLTEGSHCSVCGAVITAQKVIAATGHTWDEGEVTKEATSTETGIKTYTCTVCGETKTEVISTGVCQAADGSWHYYINGVIQEDYTGFRSNSNGKWYIEGGDVTFKTNGVIQDKEGTIGTKGTWYYVIGSKVQTGYTGVADYANANGWWYIKNGVVDFSANTVAKNKNGWWYVVGGKVQFGYTGVANYANSNGWWYIKNGKVDFTANTVAKNKNGWWYVVGGKVQFGYTGVANYANSNGWWYIKNGKVDFSFNGIASNAKGSWVIKNGKVNFSYNGTYKYKGKTYRISGGKVK